MNYLRIDMAAIRDPEETEGPCLQEIGKHCFSIGPLCWDDGKPFSLLYLLQNKELFHNHMEYVRRIFVKTIEKDNDHEKAD